MLEAGFGTGPSWKPSTFLMSLSDSMGQPDLSNGDYTVLPDGNVAQTTRGLLAIQQLVLNQLNFLSRKNPTLSGLTKAVQKILTPLVPETLSSLDVVSGSTGVDGRYEISITAVDADTGKAIKI